jgi:rhamnosyltransferase subunit B
MRFVITSFGSLGDLNPYIGLGLALKSRGHEAVLAIPHYYVPYAGSAGLTGHPIRPDVDPSSRDIVRKIMHPFRGAEFLIRKWMMPNVEAAYEDLDALLRDDDVLVSHPLTYAAPVVAERRGLMWASSVLAPLGFFSRLDPPLMVVHPFVEAVRQKAPGLYRHLPRIADVTSRTWGREVATLRQRLGLPRGANPVVAGQFSPYLNLGMFSRHLARPQLDWPANTVVTGAVSYDAVHGGMPRLLEEFLDSGPPPLVFTLGSSAVASKYAPTFYQASIDAAAALGVRAVLLVGQHDAHRPETKGSADVFIADWAPHSELFARALATVHQGGAGTLHTALASGKPMLIVPFAHDQGDNAVRAAQLGVASVVFPSQYTRKRVAGHLEVLTSQTMQARSATVGETIRAEHGADNACEALEQLAARRLAAA